jgi:hypothetical protein
MQTGGQALRESRTSVHRQVCAHARNHAKAHADTQTRTRTDARQCKRRNTRTCKCHECCHFCFASRLPRRWVARGRRCCVLPATTAARNVDVTTTVARVVLRSVLFSAARRADGDANADARHSSGCRRVQSVCVLKIWQRPRVERHCVSVLT